MFKKISNLCITNQSKTLPRPTSPTVVRRAQENSSPVKSTPTNPSCPPSPKPPTPPNANSSPPNNSKSSSPSSANRKSPPSKKKNSKHTKGET